MNRFPRIGLASVLLAMVLATAVVFHSPTVTLAATAKAASKPHTFMGQIWNPPIIPPVELLRTFRAPLTIYGAGHRGVDYLTTDGMVALAPGSGTIVFSGLVALKPVVAIQHAGGLKTAMEPVCGVLPPGTPVLAGQVVGAVCGKGYVSHCLPALCLHFSLRNGKGYLSPELLFGDLQPSRVIA